MNIEFLSRPIGFSLEDTLVFDELYEPELQMDLFNKISLFETPSFVSTFMKINGKLAGEVYGTCANDVVDDCEEMIPDERSSMWQEMYCFSCTLLPEYRYNKLMMSVSILMKQHWIHQVRAQGYRHIAGHATSSGAERLNRTLGAVFFPEHNIPNIFCSGRLGRYYELSIR